MEVKIIPAKPGAKENLAAGNSLRVAAYARVSTDLEEQENSYEAQCKHYLDYINHHKGWTLAGIYADEGLSGISTKGRTEFNRMITDCEAGLIDMVITKSISRFARNTLDCLQNVRKLKALNIPILFEKENINTMGATGELFLTIMASIAQQESASISQNTRMGWQYVFQQGRPVLNQNRFLGYTKSRGDKQLTIVPEEAAIVRRIFRWFLEGYSLGEIIFSLEESSIPSPAGNETWLHSTLLSMLQNEKYMGDLLLQKYYVADFLTQKRMKNTGYLPQYYVKNAHDPIIPREVFARAQGELLRRRQNNGGRRTPVNRNPLFGKVYCSSCSKRYSRYKGSSSYPATLWRCRNRKSSGCLCRAVSEQAIQDAVITAFDYLPEYREDLIRLQERLRWGGIERIDRESIDLDERRKELEDALSSYAQTDTLDKHLIFLYGNGSNNADAAVPGIQAELESLSAMNDELLIQKSVLATKEAQIRSLLALTVKPGLHGISPRPSRLQTETDEPTNSFNIFGSCSTLEDFYKRTDPALREIKHGTFDPAFVRRFIDRIEIQEDGIEIHFKAGISIEVSQTDK